MLDKPTAAPGAETLEAWKQSGSVVFDTSSAQSLEALQQSLKDIGEARKTRPAAHRS